MTTLDWIVLLILGASVVFGLIRGLVGEIFSLAAWVVAFLAAQWGAAAIGPWLPLDVQSEGMRYFVGFCAVFLAAMIVMMLLGRLVKGMVGAFGLGGVDKAVGGVFGLLWPEPIYPAGPCYPCYDPWYDPWSPWGYRYPW